MDNLLLIPGPSPVVPRVLAALAAPTVSHVGPDLVKDMKTALSNLKKIVLTADGEPFLIAGAGTLAMEIALLNTAGPEDRIVVLSQGFFGDRMGQICRSFGLAHDLIVSPWGRIVPPEDLARALDARSYALVVVTHVDTSTGACAPVRAYAEVLRGRDILFIVDGVCATGGIEERLDDWGIDVVLTAAQKCFGAPPGLALDVFSARALAKRRRLGSVPAYYSDILRWLPVMKDPSQYFSTPGVNEVRAFAEATRIMMEEGMPARFARHARTGAAMRAGLRSLGFGLFTDETCLADTLSVVRYPAGLDDQKFRGLLAGNGVVVAGGLGETAGRVFRIGHMGNLGEADIFQAFEALERTLAAMGHRFEPGISRTAAAAALTP
jgi:aspartate aminotransferase-like enzyme